MRKRQLCGLGVALYLVYLPVGLYFLERYYRAMAVEPLPKLYGGNKNPAVITSRIVRRRARRLVRLRDTKRALGAREDCARDLPV